MVNQPLYTVGGTVQAAGGIYIKRQADDELLELCKRGEYAYILSARQVGKSSLITNVWQQLKREHIQSVIIDLSSIGTSPTEDQWYQGILYKIWGELSLSVDVFEWWKEHNQIGLAQRFTTFLESVLLKEIADNAIIFFDEIDTILSTSFSNDFFASLRSLYNARSTRTILKKLSIVLIGVATPGDLISDAKRTPWNIGHRIDLKYFDLDDPETLRLGIGFGQDTTEQKNILNRIFAWTNGHPYLTQLLCAELSKEKERLSNSDVQLFVKSYFLSEQGRLNSHFQYIRDMLLKRAGNPRKVVHTYKRILEGESIKDSKESADIQYLKLSGIVSSEDERLVISNNIYRMVFDVGWANNQLRNLKNVQNPFLFAFWFIVIFIGIIISGTYYGITRNLPISLAILFAYEFTLIIYAGFQSVWKNIEGKLSAITQNVFLHFFGFRYRRRYLDYLYQQLQYSENQNYPGKGGFHLQLHEIYLELQLEEKNALSEIRTASWNGYGYPIWFFLSNSNENRKPLVITGGPGTGKTTLLKYIALTLAKSQKLVDLFVSSKKVPIFLSLRNLSPKIIESPNTELTSILSDAFATDPNLTLPYAWFENLLSHGHCIVLLDGLDRIANKKNRLIVMKWIERQTAKFDRNRFLITSRPHILLNTAIKGASILQIMPLQVDQIEKFIQYWYLATERRLSQSDNIGVRMLARAGANDLLSRIQNTEALHPLAQNPLLLTMIVTLHRFDAQLPGRRIEFYSAIFKVFFRRRDEVENYNLQAEQVIAVLAPLASFMMENGIRDIRLEDAIKVIKKELAEICGEEIQPEEFLRGVQDQSGLLLEVAENEFSFASLTFQEYLASVYYVETQNVKKLIDEIKNSWWWETIRLFCAQSDGTQIIEACLANEPIEFEQLQLAINCLEEALRVEVDVRQRLNDIIRQGVDNPDTKWRNVIATALLSKRLRFMERIDARRLIDSSLVTNVEYQIFLDDEANKGYYYYPDHWIDRRFPSGKALEPVTGIRISDVEKFCEWLVPRDIWRYRYRLPEAREVVFSVNSLELNTGKLQYWLFDSEKIRISEARRDISPRYKQYIIEQMFHDAEVFRGIRAAAEREKAAKLTSEILASAQPIDVSTRHFNIASKHDGMISELHKMETERFMEWNLLIKFRKFAVRMNIDFEQFLNCVSIVNVVHEDQIQYYDWMPAIPIPPEYGFDLGKEILEYSNRYPPTQLRNMLGKKINVIVSAHETASHMILERSWAQLAQGIEDHGDIYDFVRSIARISLLAMALTGKARYPSFSRDTAGIYLMYCLLERRIEGKEPPVEGIRLVKIS